MVLKKRIAGRPIGGTSSLDKDIVRFLMENEGTAGWRELKKVRGDPPVADGVLGTAINRLLKRQQIVPEALLCGGKAVTLYHLRGEVPSVEVDGESIPLLKWIRSTANQLAAAKTDWLRNADGRRGKAGTLDETLFPPADLRERQGTALAIAMKTLTSIILDEIFTSYFTDSEEERAQYLDAMCRIYLSVIIKEIALLAHPAHGDLESAIRIAKGQLLGIGEAGV
jgi:hypothetical protein